ncbi:hypothetical protein [Sphingomonas sp. CFBP 8765]|uniref:hypothetical protein n=1 Tax=Sphingomonas sp. CFBP 8765 TaxID=2775274 RepID=UPI001783D52C|nr:hypothetical protein [Sphingomonas sp. CFBP 8765]MBD8472068.1 hypothetical protein [Sphingomonas sp. CFBP 8765]
MKDSASAKHWAQCIVLFALATVGCSQVPDRKFRVISEKEQAEHFDHDNPVGRFTAVSAGGGGIYVLDTRKGTVRYCAEAAADNATKNWEAVRVGCTTPSEISGKQITPNIRKLE